MIAKVDAIRKVIDDNGPYAPEIEAILASALAVVIIGAYEDEIEEAIGARAGKAGDKPLESFVRESLHDAFQTPSYSNITRQLKRMSDGYKKKFEAAFVDQERSHLNSLITIRHAVAHQGELTASLADVEKHYKGTLSLVKKLKTAIK